LAVPLTVIVLPTVKSPAVPLANLEISLADLERSVGTDLAKVE